MATAPNLPPDRPEPQQPHVVVVEQQEKNGFGTSSFVLGLVGTVFGMVPIAGLVALAVSVVGLGLGLGNIGRLRRHRATNKVLTGLGIGLSVLGVVLSIIGIVIVNNTLSNL